MLEQPKTIDVSQVFGSPKGVLENMANVIKCLTNKTHWKQLKARSFPDKFKKIFL